MGIQQDANEAIAVVRFVKNESIIQPVNVYLLMLGMRLALPYHVLGAPHLCHIQVSALSQQ